MRYQFLSVVKNKQTEKFQNFKNFSVGNHGRYVCREILTKAIIQFFCESFRTNQQAIGNSPLANSYYRKWPWTGVCPRRFSVSKRMCFQECILSFLSSKEFLLQSRIFEIQMLTSDIIISSDGLISFLIQNGCPDFCSEVLLLSKTQVAKSGSKSGRLQVFI